MIKSIHKSKNMITNFCARLAVNGSSSNVSRNIGIVSQEVQCNRYEIVPSSVQCLHIECFLTCVIYLYDSDMSHTLVF